MNINDRFVFLNNRFCCLECDISFKRNNSLINHKKVHEMEFAYLKNYIKNSFENIEYIYVCWFGGYNKKLPLMGYKRFLAFKSLVETISVPIILITNYNYESFIKEEYPLHESFKYLSGVHKSDYFRVYMLHHYGGGYHDVKWRDTGWEDEWKKDNWTKNGNIWMYGRRESNENAIAYPPGKKYIQKEYNKLVTMGWIICKKKTKFTEDLINKVDNILTDNYDKLIKFPGVVSSGYYYQNPFDLVKENSYPLRWLEILGEVFHPLMLKYNDKIKFGLKDALKKKGYK